MRTRLGGKLAEASLRERVAALRRTRISLSPWGEGWGEGAFRQVRLSPFDSRKQHLVVSAHRLRAGVIRPKAIRENLPRAPHRRLGLGKTVRGLKQRRQIVQADGHLGMTGAEAGSRGLPMLT